MIFKVIVAGQLIIPGLQFISIHAPKRNKTTQSAWKMFKCVNLYPPVDSKNRSILISRAHGIEKRYEKLIKGGLKKWNGMTMEDILRYHKIMASLDLGVTKTNYTGFFRYHLWLEEAAALSGLEKYTMYKVPLKRRKHLIELYVPGLAEKRPSVRPGDIVTIRLSGYFIGYQGVVLEVLDKSVEIGKFVSEFFSLLQTTGKNQWDVKFELMRSQIIKRHNGVIKVASTHLNRVFPVSPMEKARKKVEITSLDLINDGINAEQLKAIVGIVNCTSQSAPYIIFGPPGTGKTITIIEAILQILKKNPEKKILACAPSNSACDVIAVKLLKHLKEGLLRLHALTRDVKTIPNEIICCSNFDSINRKCVKVAMSQIIECKVVVCTLGLSGNYPDFHADVLFIDEAAQATEPECDIAISLMLPGSFIVLAGDPKQLRPVCQSHIAEKKGLSQSLMERLMLKNELYQERSHSDYHGDYITMLVQNYRSNPAILHIPNNFFYKNKLLMSGPIDGISNISVSTRLNKSDVNKGGCAIEFYGLLSLEERNGASPSYFNQMEIEMVIKYVKVLLELQDFDVKEADIGIITPYIRQVSKIKEALKSLKLKDINVGTTEAYQGSEKRIIIISTVRAQEVLLEYDAKYQLGFVSNERRFNVALTRAKSKLIIIGNPYVLGTDKHWLAYINACKDLESYFGVEYKEKSSMDEVDKISSGLTKLNLNQEDRENNNLLPQLN